MKNKSNKNGFTLVEMLAVIIILGILMIIAVPSVTSYISQSRKTAYIDTAKSLVTGAKAMINDGELKLFDLNATYYIPSSCIKLEDGVAESPYGKFEKAYVVVSYTGSGYNYYFLSLDETGQGVKNVTNIKDLTEDDIKTDLTTMDVSLNQFVEGKTRIIKFNNDCSLEEEEPEVITTDNETFIFKDLRMTVKVDDQPCTPQGGYNICYNSKVAVINIGGTATIKGFKASFDVPEGTILINSGFDSSKVQVTLVGTRLTITGNKNYDTWNYLEVNGTGYSAGFQIKYPSNVEFKLSNPSIEYTELNDNVQTGESTGGVIGNSESMYAELAKLRIELHRTNYYNGNNVFYEQYDVYVTNISDQDVTNWSFILEAPSEIRNISAYNSFDISKSGNVYTLTPLPYVSQTIGAGQTVPLASSLVFEVTDTNAIPIIR